MSLSRNCLGCGNPLPKAQHYGRPRFTCSARCRMRAYRKRQERLNDMKVQQRSKPHVAPMIHRINQTDNVWSPDVWLSFRECLDACQKGLAPTFTTDTGDNIDVAEMKELAEAYVSEHPDCGLQWSYQTDSLQFWSRQDTQETFS